MASHKERGRLEDFHGDRSLATTFVAHFNNYMRLNKTIYTDDEDKISLFFNAMKGEVAGKWAEARMKEYDADQLNPALIIKRWTQLSDVIKAFQDEYKSVDPVTAARNALETLRMTGDYASIDKFMQRFNTLATESEFDEPSLIYFLRRSLNPSLVDRIATSFPQPKDLKEYKERAVTMQLAWENRQIEKKQTRGTVHTTSSHKSASTSSNANDQGVPMDIDSARRLGASSIAPLTRLTDAERENLRRQGACFRCRQKGHMSRECPNRSTPRTSSTPSSSSVRGATTSTPTADPIAQLSNAFNMVDKLEGDEKDQAVAFLKDALKSKDF